MNNMISIIRSADLPKDNTRMTETSQNVVAKVAEIMKDVKSRGIDAVLEYTLEFDKASLNASNVRVKRQEIEAAYERADKRFVDALRDAASNIRVFHEKQKRYSQIEYTNGKTLGTIVSPIKRVGIYAPGGTAGYPSSVLMNAIPAKVAGVDEVVMVTPPGEDGEATCALSLIAADIAGVSSIYKVGGAQAVAALAFGASPIPQVDKIVGPGNAYVAEAKRQVFGVTGIDSVAGPSEVFVIADETANASWVAADMLAQAEHDVNAATFLATPCEKLALAVQIEIDRQANERGRSAIIRQSIENNGKIIITESLREAMDIANAVAPEHLELCVADPHALLGYVRNAGAVFLGHFTPEPIGDYFAGPNHVLPTSGTARFFSPLSVDDFIKKTSVVGYTRESLKDEWERIACLASHEGLDAHAKSASIRFEGMGR